MKKAIAVTELMILLLASAAGIGLIFFAKEGFEKVGCQSDIEVCKQTFSIFKGIKEKAAVFGIAPRLDCPALSPPNCKETKLETDDKRQTMHIIAENLRYCWKKTLGRDNTMGKDFAGYALITGIMSVVKNVDFCMVCSTFTPNVDISAKEWKEYFNNKKIPKSDVPYDSFIYPAGPEIFKKSYKNIDFKKGTTYYVVSVSAEASTPAPTSEKTQAFIYVDSELTCGDERRQIHYQLK